MRRVGWLVVSALMAAGIVTLPPVITRIYSIRNPPGTDMDFLIAAVACGATSLLLAAALAHRFPMERWVSPSVLRAVTTVAMSALSLSSLNYLFRQVEALRSPYLDSDFGSILFVKAWGLASGAGGLYCDPEACPLGTNYNPLFMVMTSLLFRLVGPAVWGPKLISVLSTVGIITLIVYFVFKHSGGRIPAAMSGLAFAASYTITGAWYGQPRVDMLMTFFWVAGFVLLSGQGIRPLIGIALLVLSYWTKQTALVAVGAGIFCIWMRNPRDLRFPLYGILLAMGMILIPWVLYDRGTGGWFEFWTMGTLGNQGFYRDLAPLRASFFFWMKQAPLWGLLGIMLPVLGWERAIQLRLWVLMTSAAFLTCLAAIWHVGSWVTGLIPLQAFLCMGLGLVAAGGSRLISQAAAPPRRAIVVHFLVLLQALAWVSNPWVSAERATADRTAEFRQRDALLREVKRFQGAVWIPFSPELTVLAGKKGHDAAAAVASHISDGLPLPKRLFRMIEHGDFDAVFLREGSGPEISAEGAHFGILNGPVDHFHAFPSEFVRLFAARYGPIEESLPGWEIHVPDRSGR